MRKHRDGIQAIETYFLPCTNSKPYRIVARCAAKKRIYSEPIEPLGLLALHKWAAAKLCDELGWNVNQNLYTGVLKNGNYVHVQVIGVRDDA